MNASATSTSTTSATTTPLADALALVAILGAETTEAGAESVQEHALGMLDIVQPLHVDEPTRIAAVLFGLGNALSLEGVEDRFGSEVRTLVAAMRQLLRLKDLTTRAAQPSTSAQLETLRRMTLAMAADIRVVVLRLASRLQTLRHAAQQRHSPDLAMCRETLNVLAPLANRLGLGQMKWQLEDLAFRFLQPDDYKAIAQQLEARRAERASFIAQTIHRIEQELIDLGLHAEVSGRPKHIYSIWSKMQSKRLQFAQLKDLRALRIIVADIKACYTVLDRVHQFWPPDLTQFDDYISRPKPNGYRSLHTVVTAEDGAPLEVQIRTQAMHQDAELGVAAHWRYKETKALAGNGPDVGREHQIMWLRQLLMWQQEIGATLGAAATNSDGPFPTSIYVLTPQARVIELPDGATPVDFAYHVHTELGHRCRGARVDGQWVPLHTRLRTGQTVAIVTVREGLASGPSRDWLNPQLGLVRSERARAKVRQWFKAQEIAHDLAQGRERLEKILQREGRTMFALDEIARRLGFDHVQQLYLALAREQISARLVEESIHDGAPKRAEVNTVADQLVGESPQAWVTRRSTSLYEAKGSRHEGHVLVVGVDALLTQLARCCRPIPPDPIIGFVTRGRGVSIHRQGCASFQHLATTMPERVLPSSWRPSSLSAPTAHSSASECYPVEICLQARDRSGLLRDISDVLARDRLNVLAVHTRSRDNIARMEFTIEVSHRSVLDRALTGLLGVAGVLSCQRRT